MGMTITYALIQMCENIAEKTGRSKIVNKAEVFELICNGDAVVGCKYRKADAELKEFGPVVFASGGYGADFGSDSLLAKYRPHLLHLPTTNGEHCTGDAIKMGEKIGASTIDLEWVQVHPTGLVKPDDPDAKVKFLAAEALRGVGGIVIDADGKRFANELGRRDYVTGEMWKNKPPFRLCLNKAASTEIIWHCKHYTSRGVMKHYASGAEFAKDIGVSVETLVQTHNQHSGINGAGTKGQAANGIKDTVDIFFKDTMKGGAKKPEEACKYTFGADNKFRPCPVPRELKALCAAE